MNLLSVTDKQSLNAQIKALNSNGNTNFYLAVVDIIDGVPSGQTAGAYFTS